MELIEKKAQLEEIRYNLRKQASNMGVGQALAVVGIIGASVLVNQAVNRIMQRVKEKNLQNVQPEYFKKLLEKNPSLIEEDPDEVLDLWQTLYRTAPNLAQDPVAAGGFIRQNVNARVRGDLGGPTLDTYKTLSEIQSKLQGLEENYDMKAFSDIAAKGLL